MAMDQRNSHDQDDDSAVTNNHKSLESTITSSCNDYDDKKTMIVLDDAPKRLDVLCGRGGLSVRAARVPTMFVFVFVVPRLLTESIGLLLVWFHSELASGQ